MNIPPDSPHLSALLEIIGRLHASLDPNQLATLILQGAGDLSGAEAGALFLVDEENGDFLRYSLPEAAANPEMTRLSGGRGVVASLLKTGEALCLSDVSQDTRFEAQTDTPGDGYAPRSLAAAALQTQPLALGPGRGVLPPRTLGMLAVFDRRAGRFDAEDVAVLAVLSSHAAAALQAARLYHSAQALFEGSARSLAAALDAKAPYNDGHSERVSAIAAAVARQLGLDAETIYHVRMAGLLHDVGKINVPDAVLKKSGHLAAAEMAEMQKHPHWSGRILGQVPGLEVEQRAAAEHHERLDGTGYPNGLTWPEISLAGRILAVADVCAALTSERPYRAAMPIEDVLTYLRARVGMAFDANCINALERAYTQGLLPPPSDGAAP